jgi:hypothetical protein
VLGIVTNLSKLTYTHTGTERERERERAWGKGAAAEGVITRAGIGGAGKSETKWGSDVSWSRWGFKATACFWRASVGPNIAFGVKTNATPWGGSKNNVWGGSGGGTGITLFCLPLLLLLLLLRRHATVKS